MNADTPVPPWALTQKLPPMLLLITVALVVWDTGGCSHFVDAAFSVPNSFSTTTSMIVTKTNRMTPSAMMMTPSASITYHHHGRRRLLSERRVTLQRPSVRCFAISSLDNAPNSAAISDDDGNNGTPHDETTSSNLVQPPPNLDTVNAATTEAVAGSTSMQPGFKLRRLKDIMWVRETLEDLTAAEFACTVETTPAGGTDDDEADTSRPKRRRRRAVDYEKLLNQLHRRIRDLGCNNSNNNNSVTSKDVEETNTLICDLESGTGMGSLTYTDAQRTALLDRLLQTRGQLIQVIHGTKTMDVESMLQNLPPITMMPPFLPRMEIPKEDVEDALSPKLYVRDDGTVDWDGALTSGAALRQFGTAVWARINGRDSDSVEEHEVTQSSTGDSGNGNNGGASRKSHVVAKVVTAKIVETPEIVDARVQLENLSKKLVSMEKEHYKLLNSVISQGQATANIRLAMLDSPVRTRIQASAAALDNIKVRVSFQTLVYEMERIYTYLVGELGNPALTGYIPLPDRLNVAEFGLLESQVDSFNRQFVENESVDEDVLAVIYEQLTDFKRRLGIDYYVAGLSFDREAIGRWLGELWDKTKSGLAFYVKGVRLFWNDIVFCLKLINRAAQGYTLKPREVRTIRRTFKDVITFIPFVIILLIPLSPIGHVLVFGAIQRFFPDFFPSCFTEQRQNLLQLYETTEYSELVINETWREKLSRASEAIVYVTVKTLKALFNKLMGFRRSDSSDDDNSGESVKKQ